MRFWMGRLKAARVMWLRGSSSRPGFRIEPGAGAYTNGIALGTIAAGGGCFFGVGIAARSAAVLGGCREEGRQVSIERIYYCDGPECNAHCRTATPPPYLPPGFLEVREADRDVNAARNILARGLGRSLQASTVGEEVHAVA